MESQHETRTPGNAPAMGAGGFTHTLKWLFEPVDIASLVYFRILFGLIMLYEVWVYLSEGRVQRYYMGQDFLFTYEFFSWVQPWPGDGMLIHFYVMGLLAIFITIGFCYRLSAALFLLAFTYMFLLEQARYLNHFYFVSLISFLMIFVPAHRSASVDARLRPHIRTEAVPAWGLWILRFQMGVVYFFGGIAKINGDWMRGWPLRIWLPRRDEFPIIGSLLDEPWMAVFFSWSGLILDLFAVPALLWRRTRWPAFLLLVTFHLMNAELFNIGIFPWFSIGMTALFFSPGWPRKVFNWPLRHSPPGWNPAAFSWTPGAKAIATALGVYMAIQCAVPLRHWLYPGDVAWTEEGHRFSWRMKLRDKSSRIRFSVTHPKTGETARIDPGDYLTSRQERKMSTRPYLIQQFAFHLENLARQNGHGDVEVRALVRASLNGRKAQLLVDPEADLTAQPAHPLRASDWIVPLTTPLEGEHLARK